VTGTRLRVALDARRLQDVPLGGVGRSLAGVIDLLAAEVDLTLLTDARQPPIDTAIAQHALRPPPRSPELVWMQWSVPRWLRHFDGVFHGTFNQLPLRTPVPSVVTIHDLSFELHPEGFGRGKRQAFCVQARHAARVASRILAPSEFTRDEIITHYGAEADRVAVTPWGVEARFGDACRAAVDAPAPTRRYVVAMGGAPRRGLDVAIGAWRAVCNGDAPDLVVVGREQPPSEPGLIAAGGVDDREWARLLAGAAAFCYPTRYEGFGVPALESMASGTPVVCAPVASLPEVLGDAAEWCATPSVDAIAAGLRNVLHDPVRAAELRRRGLARAEAQPSWEHTADVMLRAYRDAARS
jgi:glycosyltransferase involved in cell wall biosynthesis